MKSWEHLSRPQTCLLTGLVRKWMILLRGAPPLMVILELWALIWWETKIFLKAPVCSACSSLALLKKCFYQNSNSNRNNERCLPPVQRWRPGNLCSGWHILAATFIAGNQEMLSRAGTDGMARRQASGLGAREVRSLELTKLTCPWKSLLDWHFWMENFCLRLLRNSTTFE